MIQIVGLIGEPGVGKDAIADFAVEDFGARRIAFADPIREIALAIDSVVGVSPVEGHPEQLMIHRMTDVVRDVGWTAAKQIPEVRRTLQRIGTEAGRQIINEDLWVSLGFRRLLAYYNGSGQELELFVFTDVRFINEATKIRTFAQELGGEARMVRVKRPGHGSVNNHASESSYDDIPHEAEVTNDGDLDDLRRSTAGIFNNIFKV